MGTTANVLHGTTTAPLAATIRYEFTRAQSNRGLPAILIPVAIPVRQRGSGDDYGEVERLEQQAWLWRFFASLDALPESGWPGEFLWPDEATRDRVWSALADTLRAPAKSPPSVTLERTVSAADARAASEAASTRFCALLAALYGCDERRFTRLSNTISDDDYEPVRNELWKCDDVAGPVFFRVVAKGLGSGVGVHGEDASYVLDTGYSDGRTARASSRIDMRTGGSMSVTVAGALDAEQLARAWLFGAT